MKTAIFWIAFGLSIFICIPRDVAAQAPAGIPFGVSPAGAPQSGQAGVPDDTVVAKVDGKSVTAGEIRRAVEYMPPEFTRMFDQNPQFAVQQLFLMRHLSEEAEKAKLSEQSPLKEQLEMARENIMASAMLTHEHNEFHVTQEKIDEYYTRNQAKFQQAKVKAIGIAFKPAGSGVVSGSLEDIARASAEGSAATTQRSEADARKLATDLVKQIREGADFVKLVAQYSDDGKSKAAAGDFGVINNESAYPEELKRNILALKPGEVTEPFRKSALIYILRVEQKDLQTQNEVSEAIVQDIKKAHANEWFQDLTKRFAPAIENVQFFAKPTNGPAIPGMPMMTVPPAAAQPKAK